MVKNVFDYILVFREVEKWKSSAAAVDREDWEAAVGLLSLLRWKEKWVAYVGTVAAVRRRTGFVSVVCSMADFGGDDDDDER